VIQKLAPNFEIEQMIFLARKFKLNHRRVDFFVDFFI